MIGNQNAKSSDTRAVLLIAAAAALLRIPSIVNGYWNPDEPTWMVLGQAMNDGHVLYRDVVDQIPPLGLHLYAVLQRVFGDGNAYAIEIAGALWVAVICWAIAKLAGRIAGPQSALAAAAAYGIFSITFDPDDFLAFNGETIANGLITLAALLMVRAPESKSRTSGPVQLLLSGALLALAASTKTQAIVILIAFLAWNLFARRLRAPATMGWMLGGACIIEAGWYLQALWSGAAADAFHLIVEHQMSFAQTGGIPVGYLVLKFIWQFGKIALCGLPLWALGIWGMVRSARRNRHPEMLLLLFWFLFAMVPVFAGGRMYGHYFLLAYPPLAIAAGIEGVRLAQSHKIGRRIAAVSVLFAIGSAIGWTTAAALGSGRLKRFPQESRFLSEHTSPGDRAFVWGYAPQIYLDAGRHAWPAFYSNSFLVGSGFGSPGILLTNAGAWTRFMADFQPRNNRARPAHPELVCSKEWERFLTEWDADPPAVLVDTSPSGHSQMYYPVSNYPLLHKRLAGWSGPIRAGSMEFWFPPSNPGLR